MHTLDFGIIHHMKNIAIKWLIVKIVEGYWSKKKKNWQSNPDRMTDQ